LIERFNQVWRGEILAAEVLDGRRVADEIKSEVAAGVREFVAQHNFAPCLAAVRVGDDAASEVYVRNKIRACEELGLRSEHIHLSAKTTMKELLDAIANLNARDDVDGILVQLPLPKGLDERNVLEAVDPAKDVDGFHPLNVGRLMSGQPALAPCTPAGIIELLERNQIEMRGARAVVVGRSNIVGRPVAQLLLQRDATVTVCHSRTRNLAAVTREADILIVAIGRAGLIRGEHVKEGATVVDVGMNRVDDEALAREFFGEGANLRINAIRKRGFTLVGDVHPLEVENIAGKLTPVPGGVGLLTVAMLMKNTLTAALRRRQSQVPSPKSQV
jgi:methylenetetrahydrofolate dehydrogenase (NADP+)/methenyltetrahydrofolate cyclohydrolase